MCVCLYIRACVRACTCVHAADQDSEDEEEEDSRDILGELDERLRKKPTSSVQFKVSAMKEVCIQTYSSAACNSIT